MTFSSLVVIMDEYVDIDGDGVKDYFIQDSEGTYYYKGLGNAKFGEVIELKGLFNRHHCLLTDYENDGDPDVIGLDRDTKEFIININKGGDQFDVVRLANQGVEISYFTVIDVNDDGLAEIIFTSDDKDAVYLLNSKQNYASEKILDLTRVARISSYRDKLGVQVGITYDASKFVKIKFLPDGSFETQQVATERQALYLYKMDDFTGDSIVDILTTTMSAAYLKTGNAVGTMNAEVSLGTTASTHNFDYADIDGDGDKDFVFPCATIFQMTISRNQGNGAFVYEAINNGIKSTSFQWIESGSTAFINGALYENALTTAPYATNIVFNTNEFIRGAVAEDLDGDGDIDMVAASYLQEYFMVFENINGKYARRAYYDNNADLGSFFISDYNRDGKKDLIFLWGNELRYLKNLGNCKFANSALIYKFSSLPEIKGGFSEDINGDGNKDLILTTINGYIYVVINSGSGYLFTPEILYASSGQTEWPSDLKVVDFDKDGQKDLVLTNFYGNLSLIKVGAGTLKGTFIKLSSLFGLGDFEVIDVNNDQFPDIVVYKDNGNITGTVGMFINNGNNTVKDMETIASVSRGFSIEGADFNGDGRMDISIVEDNSNRLLWLFNLGNGAFSEPIVIDPFLAKAETGDVIGDYHFYFGNASQGKLQSAFVIDAALYVSQFDAFQKRHYTVVSNEVCNDNYTAVNTSDDYKSFDLVALDFDDMAGNYSIYDVNSNWSEEGVFGKKLAVKLPAGSAGSGDKNLVIENLLDGSKQAILIKDDVLCVDTSLFTEVDALMTFHNEAGGINWTESTLFDSKKWKDLYVKYQQKLPITSAQYCGLPGVTCANGSVTSIKIQSQNVSGIISPALAWCRKLENLELRTNNIVGLPSTLSGFKSLKRLDVFGNKISGSIPEDIGEMTNLEHLNLGANLLTGSIPTSITRLTKLQKFLLGGGGVNINKITGNIPEEIGNMTSLNEINFVSQKLTGELPASMGNLKKMEIFNIYSTEIGGQLPESLADMYNPALKTVNLNGNKFTGCIPASYKVFCGLPVFSIRFGTGDPLNSVEFCANDKYNCSADIDMDGYTVQEDCNDTSAGINPGVQELGFNQIDENCDDLLLLACDSETELNYNSIENAFVVCKKMETNFTLFPDAGRVGVLDNCFESTAAHSAIWFKLKAFSDGKVYFNIAPGDPNTDVDFAVYKMTDPSYHGDLQLVRCHANDCPGPIGLATDEIQIATTGFCDANAARYLSALDVTQGEYYAIEVRYAGNKQINAKIAFCGSAMLGDNDVVCTKVYNAEDGDGDGINVTEDCNDNDADIYPGATELPFNSIDENCDGILFNECYQAGFPSLDFASYTTTKIICTKDPITYTNTLFGKDPISVSCDNSNKLFNSYVTIQKIKILKGGSFYFKIETDRPEESIIFTLFKTSNNFDRSKWQQVRCVMAGLFSGYRPSAVGLSPGETDLEESAYEDGSFQNGFVKPIDAEDGDEYVIYTNSFKPQLKITTTYCGTASFVNDNNECSEIYTSTKENETNSDWRISPNPASDKLLIEGPGLIDKIELIDLSGKIWYASVDHSIVEVSACPPGMYLIKIYSQQKSHVRLFVKK